MHSFLHCCVQRVHRLSSSLMPTPHVHSYRCRWVLSFLIFVLMLRSMEERLKYSRRFLSSDHPFAAYLGNRKCGQRSIAVLIFSTTVECFIFLTKLFSNFTCLQQSYVIYIKKNQPYFNNVKLNKQLRQVESAEIKQLLIFTSLRVGFSQFNFIINQGFYI